MMPAGTHQKIQGKLFNLLFSGAAFDCFLVVLLICAHRIPVDHQHNHSRHIILQFLLFLVHFDIELCLDVTK